MNHIVNDNPSIFVVVTGAAHRHGLMQERPAFANGITFRQRTASGAIDLNIAAPADLAAFADLSAAAILKPVCLPIALTHLRHGIVHARLRDDPAAHRLAQTVLAGIAAITNPAP